MGRTKYPFARARSSMWADRRRWTRMNTEYAVDYRRYPVGRKRQALMRAIKAHFDLGHSA